MFTYRCLKHLTKGHVRAGKFEHVVFKNKVVPPHVFNVGFKGRSKRTVIVKSSYTAVYFEGLGVEELSLE